jgi:hypothetical protein
MTRLADVAVTGIGFWSPRLPGWALAVDVAAGRAAAPADPLPRPAPTLLAPTERRRAPDTVALALEVASRACAAANREPKALPSVFASTYGDLPINDYMCSTLATTPKLCSPTKFHNSVHNAAAGYWTIGTGSLAPSTAILAGPDTFAAGLVEAVSQALCDSTPVLLVAYDVEARGPLATQTQSQGLLAVALVIEPGTPATAQARLACTLEAGTPGTSTASAVPDAWIAALPANAMRPALPLFGALATGRATGLEWRYGSGTVLRVDVLPGSGA